MKIYIQALTTLQDARYCAAMGIDYVGFSLERGSARKLPVTLVWNMAQWITGPEIVLHLNADSLEELEEARQSVAVAAITLPLSDAAAGLSVADPAEIILQGKANEIAEIQGLLARYPALRFEVTVDQVEDIPADLPAENMLVHFFGRETLRAFLATGNPLGYALVLGAEALDESGELDYAFLDDVADLLQPA